MVDRGVVASFDYLDPVSIRVKHEGETFHVSFIRSFLELASVLLEFCRRSIYIFGHDSDMTESSVRFYISVVNLEVIVIL